MYLGLAPFSENTYFGLQLAPLTTSLLFLVKEEVKPIWQESAEKKQQAFTDQDLDPLNQRKGTIRNLRIRI